MSAILSVKVPPHFDNLPSLPANGILTYRQFCATAQISLSHFKTLKAQGLAPRVTYLSARCPRVTVDDANDWLRRRQGSEA